MDGRLPRYSSIEVGVASAFSKTVAVLLRVAVTRDCLEFTLRVCMVVTLMLRLSTPLPV